MFRCELTGELSNDREKPVKLIVEKRPKQYLNEYNEVVAEGWEIVKELKVRASNLEKARKKYGVESQAVGDWR